MPVKSKMFMLVHVDVNINNLIKNIHCNCALQNYAEDCCTIFEGENKCIRVLAIRIKYQFTSGHLNSGNINLWQFNILSVCHLAVAMVLRSLF